MKGTLKLWTRDELILSLNLYLKLPFGKLHSRTPEILHLAKIIGRTPGSVAMRLNNFASVDPYHQQRGVKGLKGGQKQVQPIWNEFIENNEQLLFDSESLLAAKEKVSIEIKFAAILKGTEHLQGDDKKSEVKTRVNQDVFRRIVLVNYNSKCAISGIDIPDLLVASHIVPWSKDVKERLNPENGICLSPLYDRAYDKGYIGISEKYEILLSPQIIKKKTESYFQHNFNSLLRSKITMPSKYHPNKQFLQFHLDTIFKK